MACERLCDLSRVMAREASADGLRRLAAPSTGSRQCFWSLVLLTAYTVLVFHCSLLISSYLQHNTILHIQEELLIDGQGDAAVTVCNENPFKLSALDSSSPVQQLLDEFRASMEVIDPEQTSAAGEMALDLLKQLPAVRGHPKASFLIPVYMSCNCSLSPTCLGLDVHRPPAPHEHLCICIVNVPSGGLWPCYLTIEWAVRVCPSCSRIGSCDYVSDQEFRLLSANMTFAEECLCQDITKLCIRIIYENDTDAFETTDVLKPPTQLEDIMKIWQLTTPAPIVDTSRLGKQFSFTYNFTDAILLSAKVREDLVLASSMLNRDVLEPMLYTFPELIRFCSINGQKCVLNRNVMPVYIPDFGQCFTISLPVTNNTRQGLQMEVLVNHEEYLPTTDYLGIAMAIHNKNRHPQVTDFNLRLSVGFSHSFTITQETYLRDSSNCLIHDDIFFKNTTYSMQDCLNSCFQNRCIVQCGCSHPSYPTVNRTARFCRIDQPRQRICIEKQRNFSPESCQCRQPCFQETYRVRDDQQVTWPATSAQLVHCPLGITRQQCLHYYRLESLRMSIKRDNRLIKKIEKPSSSLEILLARLGGCLALWVGLSLIGAVELLAFIIDCITNVCLLCSKNNDQQLIRSNGLPTNRSLAARSADDVDLDEKMIDRLRVAPDIARQNTQRRSSAIFLERPVMLTLGGAGLYLRK